MRTKHVVVLPYDKKWKQNFVEIKNELAQALGELAISIEHVGSTSVEGLAAKPIIDIDVVVKKENINDVVSALNSIGYIHEGDFGIPGREAFAYEGKEHLQQHHLYVCHEESLELKRHLAFRDYLRVHQEAVDEYGKIKMEAASLYPEDIDKYIEYKAPVIEKIYSDM
ncbi:MAG: GrpB family protein [Lachnospiraceae bacterium]|nr:GrpB family protein [Lachnospiraceae bacterium]